MSEKIDTKECSGRTSKHVGLSFSPSLVRLDILKTQKHKIRLCKYTSYV